MSTTIKKTKTKLELVKEVKTGKTTYWVKVDDCWTFPSKTLEEAEAKYEWCLALDEEDSIEILKTNI
jgi:hypothetical protein